jgi:NADH:ubiquinone oxidoreductase subunit E
LPATGHIVTVCDCAACRFAGGPALLAALEEELGIRAGETTRDGSVSLEVGSDVGAGSISPAIRVDTLVYGPLDAEKARHIVHERRRATATAGSAG